jgi:thiamine biosynthesis lipoprotein
MSSSTISGREAVLKGLRAFGVLVALLSMARFALRPAEPHSTTRELRGEAMGTTYSVVLAGDGARRGVGPARTIVESELRLVTDLMSTYDPESELSRFNRDRSLRPFPVSRPTLEVFALAQQISERSGGAFDVTVGPLVAAWGFGATNRVPAAPSPAELEAARAVVGFRHLRVDAAGGTIAKDIAAVECDLSGIAKGFAVDRIVDSLNAAGYADVLVEVGGDLRASGHRAEGERWRIAIERPVPRRRTEQQRLLLSDRALATSGDYRSYYESDGHRISHLIDPRSGGSIDNRVASVSVVHDSAAAADAWATALSVLGVDDGLATAEREGLAVLFLVRGDSGIEEVTSPAFTALDGRSSPSLPGTVDNLPNGPSRRPS